MSDSRCEVTHAGELGRCTSEAMFEVLVGCVHEHVRYVKRCRLRKTRDAYCRVCFESSTDSHLCTAHVIKSRPLAAGTAEATS